MQPDSLDRLPSDALRIVETTDPDELQDGLFALVPSAASLDLAHQDRPLAARGQDCGLPHTGFSYAYYVTPVHLRFAATGAVRQKFCLAGNGQVRLGSTILPTTPRASCTIPQDVESELDFGAGYRQLVVRYSVDALTRKLAALLGANPAVPLAFDANVDSGSPEDQRLRRSVFFLAQELDLAGRTRGHPALAELEQLMMLNFLFASRHNYRHLLQGNAADATPPQVRRAEEFITANLDKPITIEAIAAATGASVRSIFKAFRQSRGYTPMTFAKTRRLERVRETLQRPSATTTVTGVALLYGFNNQGHFARDYRERFGELPSQTLRRSRGDLP